MILVFDVNETLLDLSGLDDVFGDVFSLPDADGRSVREDWFTELLHQALVTTVTGPFVDFGTLAKSAMRVTAFRQNHELSEAHVEAVMQAVRTLPPHEDVVPALDRLAEASIPLVALSNGTPDALDAQLRNAGLTDRFDRIVSAQASGRLKPAAEPYLWVAEHLGVEPDELWMVAAHAWDTTGALRAGLRAAFVRRPGKHIAPVDSKPDVAGDTLVDVAEQLANVAE